MNVPVKRIVLTALAMCLMFVLTGCWTANAKSQDSAAAEEATSTVDNEALRADIEAAIAEAANMDYDNVTFVQNTETSAIATSQGQTQQQTTTSTMKGELSKTEDNRGMHIAYSQSSNAQLGKTTYDMFIDQKQMIVEQSGKLYVDALDENGFDSYAASITALASEEEVKSMLDVSKDYKMEQDGDDTVISITIDVDKMIEEEMVDTSSLPEGSGISTMVMSYTIDKDHRFKTIRLMSSTSGSPTYHVSQTYKYSDYNATTLPAWPDLDKYMKDQMGIQTDANGNMFIVGDDGTVQYIERIGDDGTIYFKNTDTQNSGSTSSGTTSQGTATTTTTTTDTTSNTTSNTSGTTSNSGTNSEDVGRAYITASDGTIHYLDEPGSEIRDLGGATVFIDANGEWYFLSYGDEE